MTSLLRPLLVSAMLVTGGSLVSRAGTGAITVSVQAESAQAITLVRHEDDWRFFKGTAAPQPDWRTAGNAALAPAWGSGPGGFGYGDSGIADEATNLPDMRNGYTSCYIRQEFEVAEAFEPDWRMQLWADFDDGFVVSLDGAEVWRENAPGVAGEDVPFSETAPGSREASCCNSPTNPARTFDLGPLGDRLSPGRHVLAIQGLNQARDSSDFHLIVDLLVAPRLEVQAGRYLTLSRIPTVTLVGTNTVPAVKSLWVDGAPAEIDAGTGGWTREQTLDEGFNRLLVEGRDEAGLPVANAHLDVVRVDQERMVEGPLRGEVVWSPADGTIVVEAPIELLANARLTIAPGTVVLFESGAGMTASDAWVVIEGTAESPVRLLPADGSSPWAGLEADGGDGGLTVRHAEMVAGRIDVVAGATGVLEDCVIRDLPASTPIVRANGAALIEVRRCYLARYYETLFQYTPTLVEDCLLEDFPSANSDGIDFDGAPAGSAIRRCTIRHGSQTNSDAIDIGSGSNGVRIEGCWLADFSDKGVSIGEDSHGIVVSNCLIHDTGVGVEVKDGCTSGMFQSTVANCDAGFRLRIKTGSEGGHLTNSFNNILWGNAETLVLLDDSTIVATHSLMQGLPVAGEGNRDEDPLFLDPAARDYRLPAGSVLRTAGVEDTPVGALLPVGAVIAPSHVRLQAMPGHEGGLALGFAADSSRGYAVQSAGELGAEWQTEAVFLPVPWPHEVKWSGPGGSETRFFRVRSLPTE